MVALCLSGAALFWTVTHFAITTDTAGLIASDVPYRQDEIAFEKAFPQSQNLIVAVVDADTPETADGAARSLVEALRTRPDIFENVRQPEATPFLKKNGLLLLPTDQVRRLTRQLEGQAPLLASLAHDPTLHGLARTFAMLGQASAGDPAILGHIAPLASRVADTLEGVLSGHAAALSWRELLSPGDAGPDSRRAIVLVNPKLDFNALEPGKAAITVLRALAQDRRVTAKPGVRLRLTGSVPLADEEFATVAENASLNVSLTILAVAGLLFLALRSARLILAALVTLFVGLLVTSGVGLALVGQLTLISVAFAVLFVGLGVDFGIQFSVRYRSERHALNELRPALHRAAIGVGLSLTLAATSLLAGFFSFLPTEFRGVSELGLIAGIGMLVAFVANLTLLPALIVVLRPGPEIAPVSTPALAALDRWVERHRLLVVLATAALVVAGLPSLIALPFDSNPMNLRSQTVESVATFLDLSKDPVTAPNKIEVLAPTEAAVLSLTEKLTGLAEVDHTTSIATFLPTDQTEKLAMIQGAASALSTVLLPSPASLPPGDAETVVALRSSAATLNAALGDQQSPGAEVAQRVAQAFVRLAQSDEAVRRMAQQALFANFPPLLDNLRQSLSAERITREDLPPDLVSEWIVADGRARIEVSPAGNSNDNAVLQRFADTVRTIAPNASGPPIGITEAGKTIVRAFLHAGFYALAAITVILWIALRRLSDVVLALGPLVVAGIVTLEFAALIGLPLNFANIIALPLMFGVGVAFHIYYLIAWRAGVVDVLASSLTRAIFFSALTTGAAFGSLWASSHPGTSSMGELLAISLIFTLLAAFLVVPAFLGPPPQGAAE